MRSILGLRSILGFGREEKVAHNEVIRAGFERFRCVLSGDRWSIYDYLTGVLLLGNILESDVASSLRMLWRDSCRDESSRGEL